MKIIPTAQMSKTTRELSSYAIPRPAAGVMRGALRRRRWEPAGWAGIWRLGDIGPRTCEARRGRTGRRRIALGEDSTRGFSGSAAHRPVSQAVRVAWRGHTGSAGS